MLVIGIETVYVNKGAKVVLINPINYEVNDGDKFYVIADNQNAADKLSRYKHTKESQPNNGLSINQISLEHAFFVSKQLNNTYICSLTKNKIYYL